MKNQIIRSLLFCAIMIRFDTSSTVAPLMGQVDIVETGVAVQEQVNEIDIKKLYAGVMDDVISSLTDATKIPNDCLQDITISKNHIPNTSEPYDKFDVPKNSGFKSYMTYKAITDKSSKQYMLQSRYAYTGDYGIRKINDRYCVAIGTGFGAQIGDYADLILENGEIIPIIVSDIKADKDTDSGNIMTVQNGCVSEFIVDTTALSKNVMKYGDVSKATELWDSSVKEIKIYDKNVFYK